ncbi:MAG: pectate lyase precursor [Phycisphaerae bacterium]|jgi:pectate lyase|nr:pectate lyase precursor [Phycisphaerae bacterium]
MVRRISASLMLIALSLSPATGARKQDAGTENKKGEKPRIPAFPGAEGFGGMTPGGRGGKVIKVTNLKASGPGSLNAACQASGRRIVIFEVSGVIRGDVAITHPYITIAGQTAPGAGITIVGLLRTSLRGWGSKTDARPGDHDVVVRFLRVRGRPGRGDVGDCLQLSACDAAVIDHCSFAWSEDETIDLWARATNITIQWCMLEESSAKKGEPWHKFGLIAGGRSNRISIHHNLFAHHIIRSPCIGSGPADFRNNVVYHFEQGFVHHNNYIGKGGFNFVGNYYKRGGRPWCEFRRGARYYLRNNFIHGKGLIPGNPSLPGVVDKPAPVPTVKTHSPQDAYRLVLARAGCFPRDAVSKRTIKEVIASKGSYGRQSPKNLLEGLTAGKPLKDSDNDGMPDAWEKAHKLKPNDPGDANRIVPPGASPSDRHAGYTYVEYYLNELADRLVQGKGKQGQ